jgi:hypothetical protein
VTRCAAALIVLLGALALSSCAAGSGTPGPGHTSATSRPAASSTPVSAAARQEQVRVGALTQVFATPIPANSADREVVEGFRQGEILWDRSETAHRLVPGVRSYVTGTILANLVTAIDFFKPRGLVPSGTDRLFKTGVAGLSGSTASVLTCDDVTKFTEQNGVTGVVDREYDARPGQGYVFEVWHMTRLSGHWAITAVQPFVPPSARARQCFP